MKLMAHILLLFVFGIPCQICDAGQTFDALHKAICLVKAYDEGTTGESIGTGFFINNKGLLLTAGHVCVKNQHYDQPFNAFRVIRLLDDGKRFTYKAKLLNPSFNLNFRDFNRNTFYDIAALQV